MTKDKKDKNSSVISLILGIIGIIFTPLLFTPIIGIILGILGFTLIKKDKMNEKISKIAITVCLISIILGIVIYILKMF